MHKALPTGVDLFKNIITKNYFYIDKTLFIKELLALQKEVTLITRPRRFGKTLNMSMLECFFDIKQENKNIFDGLQIMRHRDITEKYQNKYPVIFITLKDMKSSTFEGSLVLLANIISHLYSKNKYIYENKILDERQKKDFYIFFDKTASEDELKLSISKLTEYLYTYHKKKVIVLIDEYDAPIDNAEMEGFYPEMIKFMRGFFGSALKTNAYLEFGAITGVQRIAKEGLFSDLNNLKVCSILDDFYSDCFGFTEDEVISACKLYNIEDSIDEIKNYYNGYRFGQKEIYNPWSILNYLENKKLGLYWVNTASTAILQNIFAKGDCFLKNAVEGLLLDIPVTMELAEHITYPIDYIATDMLWTLLLNAGYIKPRQGVIIDSKKTQFDAELVNLEVKEAFKFCIRQWLKRQKGHFSNGMETFIRALLTGDSDGMQEALNNKLGIALK